MKYFRPLLVIALLGMSVVGCSGKNLAESSTTNTTEEQARLALADKKWDEAIALYEKVITENPSEYVYYPKLSTAYAGRAGIDLLAIVKSQVGQGGSSGSGNVFDSMGQFVPTHPTDDEMSDITSAIDKIKLMPEDHRTKGGPYDYSSETSFTLNIYLSSSSAMLVNRYSETDEQTGELDQEKLEEMTDDEVDQMFKNLDDIVASGDEDLGPAVQETLDAINATEGATQKEKLLKYIAANG